MLENRIQIDIFKNDPSDIYISSHNKTINIMGYHKLVCLKYIEKEAPSHEKVGESEHIKKSLTATALYISLLLVFDMIDVS